MSAEPIPSPMAAPRNYIPSPTDRFVAPVVRSRWVIGLLGAGIVLDVISIGFNSAMISLARSSQAGSTVSQDAIDLVDFGIGLTSLAGVAVYIATAVVFCCWLYRAVKNAHLLTEENSPSPGMAAASFFIPFYNLWGPFQAVKFAWISSARLAYVEESLRPKLLIVGAWWATWIIGNIIGRITLQQTMGSIGQQPTLDQLARESMASIAMSVFNIICAGLCILVTKKLTGMQWIIEQDMNDAAIHQSQDATP